MAIASISSAIVLAQTRISEVKDTTAERLAEMERQDANPDDGAIEVGKLKEGQADD